MQLCKWNAKVLFGCFNFLFFSCGVVLIAGGFLLLCDAPRLLLSRLLAPLDGGLPQPPLYYLALALLAGGLAVCAGAALGCWATSTPGYLPLALYWLAVLGAAGSQCAACGLLAAWPSCVALVGGASGSRVAVEALQAGYGVPHYEQYTAAVDLAQILFDCCGMSSASDYDTSLWQQQRLGPRDLNVPLTCCTQDGQSVSYLDPQPYNQTLCQERTADSLYRNTQGCLGKLEDWYHRHFLAFLAATLLATLVELGALLSTVLLCARLRKRRRRAAPFALGRSQHVYQSRLPDQPITAKYVQPDNFYSPRARNPQLFHTKPNEMA